MQYSDVQFLYRKPYSQTHKKVCVERSLAEITGVAVVPYSIYLKCPKGSPVTNKGYGSHTRSRYKQSGNVRLSVGVGVRPAKGHLKASDTAGSASEG